MFLLHEYRSRAKSLRTVVFRNQHIQIYRWFTSYLAIHDVTVRQVFVRNLYFKLVTVTCDYALYGIFTERLPADFYCMKYKNDWISIMILPCIIAFFALEQKHECFVGVVNDPMGLIVFSRGEQRHSWVKHIQYTLQEI